MGGQVEARPAGQKTRKPHRRHQHCKHCTANTAKDQHYKTVNNATLYVATLQNTAQPVQCTMQHCKHCKRSTLQNSEQCNTPNTTNTANTAQCTLKHRNTAKAVQCCTLLCKSTLHCKTVYCTVLH